MQIKHLGASLISLLLLCTGCKEKPEMLAMNDSHNNMAGTEEMPKKEEGMSLVPGYSPVQIDTSRLQMMGMTTAKVERRVLRKAIRTVGIIEVDETRIANIQTKFSGWIEKLTVNFVGMPVQKGQPLFSPKKNIF
jgi:membrane fusion protein, copper/silver efflux system